MKIVALGGSLREGSYTYQILKLAMQKIDEKISSELIDLRTLQLPFCNGSGHYPDYPDVDRLRSAIQSASGLLLATPEYHGSVSGVLKNALDLLTDEDIEGKVVGLIAVVGGLHSTRALDALRVICRQLHCWVLPEQIVLSPSWECFDEKGMLKDQLLEKRLTYFIEHLVAASHKLGKSS